MIKQAFAFTLALTLTACQHTATHTATDTATPASLQGQWQITATNPRTALPQSAYLTFDKDGQGSAYAGCNHMNFSYTLNGEALTIGQVSSTRMACSDMALEQFLGRHLPKINRYQIANNQLILMGDNISITTAPKL